MINYFGYGAMRNPEVIEAVIGRRPTGTPGSVSGMKLCIQRLDQMPSSVQELLRTEWPNSFRSYVMLPDAEKKVDGMVWGVTLEEREIISDWELAELGWFKVIEVQVALADGTTINATTEILEGQEFDTEVSGQDYPDLLNPEGEVLRVAEKSRKEFLSKKA